MALAKKCDVCGKLYEHYGKRDTDPNGIMIVHINERHTDYCKIKPDALLDCCPECLNSILEHINKLKNPEGPVKLGDLLAK